MERVLDLGDNWLWRDLLERENAQLRHLSVIKKLKIWCVMKNWKQMKFYTKLLEKEHSYFLICYYNGKRLSCPFTDCDYDYLGRQLEDTISAVIRQYGERFVPKLDLSDVPWGSCPYKLDHLSGLENSHSFEVSDMGQTYSEEKQTSEKIVCSDKISSLISHDQPGSPECEILTPDNQLTDELEENGETLPSYLSGHQACSGFEKQFKTQDQSARKFPHDSETSVFNKVKIDNSLFIKDFNSRPKSANPSSLRTPETFGVGPLDKILEESLHVKTTNIISSLQKQIESYFVTDIMKHSFKQNNCSKSLENIWPSNFKPPPYKI